MKRERQEGGSASKVAAFFKRNIYFVLMIVCVLAIGVIITVAAVTGTEDDPTDTPTVVVPGDDDDDADEDKNPPVVDDDDDNDSDGDDDKDDEDQKPAKTFTLDGILEEYTIDIGYSDAELVFNPTQGHWATHQGVDLIAEAGTAVKCSFDGTVKTVTDDSFHGTTVVISHDGGYETTYKLLDEVSLKVGDKVAEGDTIGTVSGDALAEMAQGAHLHLELSKDGVLVDPTSYMSEIADK